MVGMTLEAVGTRADVGARCRVTRNDGSFAEAEVVGFDGEKTFLMPVSAPYGFSPGCAVTPTSHGQTVDVGEALLGRVIDGAGKPLDDKGPIKATQHYPLEGRPGNPLARSPIHQPLDVGVRAINALLTVGRGQRMGLFAGSGVGKSVLLGMMTRYTEADVTVVGLIGERGREVVEFVQQNLGDEGLKRSVVVATPADQSPLMRLHGAMRASAIAEYFRDQGKKVLLLMDSLTRFAQAQREISLSIGEPPATKGYTPSVFAKLPRLVERAGTGGSNGGSITAFYTVLAEGDDQNDPVVDSARAILDGHIVLSREIAEAGIYPAIDLERSISRVANDIISDEQERDVRQFRALYGRYRQNEDLITVGAYQRGADQRIDQAIQAFPRLQEFLSQDRREAVDVPSSLRQLSALFDSQANAAR
jgi:flagellum-specific ATP synthase